jgi:hypothetical protein
MGKGSVILIVAGIVFGAIYIMWAVVPILFETPLQVTWTDEATYYYGNYTAEIFTAVGGAVETSVQWTYGFAEEIANQSDSKIDIIDVRVGMAMIWWELSHSSDSGNRIFPGRWTWNRWTPDQLGIAHTPQACYDIPEDWIEVDWSFEAIRYYWNPGERYYDISDQPDMIEVLRLEANGNATAFRAMFGNATAKAEGNASASDKVVDLQDLRDATAETILLQYPDRYSDLAAAQARLEELESEAGFS